ncbi:MAG: nitronate monooxygenase [Deltaproteobacteria bacterium]|nr:nitronate monooxygenase [Deltaproteobacteria bacterium]
MAVRTQLCELLGIEHPIILGGMMGVSDGVLSAAVSEAGGLGTISAATFGAEGTKREILKLKERTQKPFSVNLPIFHPEVPKIVDALLSTEVKIVTTAAGSPEKFTKALKDKGITVLHVVSSVRTALKAEAAGVDVVVAEGVDSGGKVSPDEIPTISLIPQVVDAVKIPVVAAGGLADGRGLLAALALGAVGAQFGTLFIATDEAPAHPNWKKVLVGAGDAATGVACRKSSPTRLIRNDFFMELDSQDAPGKKPMDFMMIQGQGMARIPSDSEGTKGNYTAGAGAGLIHKILPTAEIIRRLVADTETGIERLSGFRRLT